MYRSEMSSFFVYRREIVTRKGKTETGERFDTGDRGGWKNRTAIRRIVARKVTSQESSKYFFYDYVE